MRRVAVSFAVAACWFLCSLAPAGGRARRRATSTTATTSGTRRMHKGFTTGTRATRMGWMDR